MSPARRATAIALPAALIAGGITAWAIAGSLDDQPQTGPVENVTIKEADGTADQCANVVIGLPDTVTGHQKRAVKGHPGALAWGDPPIMLVCGVPAPAGLETATNLTAVNGVTWMTTQDVDTTPYGLAGKNVLWVAVDREVFVAVAVPKDESGSAVISPISTVLAQRLKSIEGK